MKRILLTLAIALLAASSLFAQLPPDSVLRRYAAGMLMVGFKGDSVTEDCDAARYVRDLKVGAIVLFDIDMTGEATLGSRNITSKERLTRMTSQLQAWADYPLLIATDQEGGKVARLKPQYGFLPTVTAEYLGTVDNEDTTRYYAARLAREMREAGVNVNLAPVVDVLNHDCAAVGHFLRCYSTDPVVIARHAGWFIDECHRQGVLCTLKHFPGHGNVKSDSHLGIPVNDTDRQKLMDTEFKTFREAIREGAEALMTAHVRYTGVDPENPATLSKIIMTDLTRKEFGFEGVIGTDCLEMDAIRAAYGCGEGAVRAIEAGVDLLTISHTYTAVSQAAQGIYEAVESGRISEQRIRESYERIMKLKAKYGLMESQSIDPEKAETMVNSQGRQFVCEDLMNEAITLLQGDFDLNLQKGGYLTVACDQTPATGAEDMKQLSFAHMMGEKFGCPAMALHLNPEPEEVSRAVASIREQLPAMRPETDDPVPLILGLYNARFREGQKAIIEEILKMKQEGLIRLYVFLLGAPYDLPLVKDADCVITTYEYTRLSLAALLKAMEEHRFPGVSPFKL